MAWSSFRDSFYLFFRRLGIFFVANILWIILSLPLITMPAATGALYYLVDCVITEESDPDALPASISDFWVGIRLYWWQSTKLMMVNFVIFVGLTVTGLFYWTNPIDSVAWLIGPLALVLFAFLTMNVYLLALRQIYRAESLASIFRRSVRLVLTYPLESGTLLVWMVLLAILFIVLAGPALFLLFSLLVLIQTNMLRAIRIRQGEVVEIVTDEQTAIFERRYR